MPSGFPRGPRPTGAPSVSQGGEPQPSASFDGAGSFTALPSGAPTPSAAPGQREGSGEQEGFQRLHARQMRPIWL
ncbi:hypothetical protein N7460_000626 [Penicillium canescens]|uniref:Uncharacterized protein n=2 Tax=Penicillium canescens TaxID=5083 RepID=A0AAD6IMX7_PENCN|nr:hypothetical protein N7460_000626 [Penicillium canescens]